MAVPAIYVIGAFMLRRRSANSRYLLGCVAILAMLGLPMGTYAFLSQDVPREAEEGIRYVRNALRTLKSTGGFHLVVRLHSMRPIHMPQQYLLPARPGKLHFLTGV